MSADETIDVCAVGFGGEENHSSGVDHHSPLLKYSTSVLAAHLAIGALYAFALDKTSRVRVTAVCRSNYNVLQDTGLDFESDRLGNHKAWKPYRVVRTVEEAADRTYAYIVCAFKSVPEITTTPALLAPLISKLASASPRDPHAPVTSTFVLLQNGIGIEDDLLEALSAIRTLGVQAVVISGCCWVDTTAVDGGRKIVQHGNEQLVLGYHRPTSPSAPFSESVAKKSLGELVELFRAGGSAVEAAPDADVARWRKVLWNASFSTVCTLARAHVGDVLALESSRQALKDIMAEVLTVARACLTPSPAVDQELSDAVIERIITNENPQSVFRPSMLVDLDHERPMEVEAIVGGVLRRARTKGVPTPRLDLIYAGLSVIQSNLIKGQA